MAKGRPRCRPEMAMDRRCRTRRPWSSSPGWLGFLIKDHGKPAQSAAAAAIPAPAVGVRPVLTKGVSQSFEFVGRIKATDKVELRARVEGFLEKVLFKEGQDVKTGDMLYQIEKAQFEAAVEQAKGKSRHRRRPSSSMPSSSTTAPWTWRSVSSVRRARSTRTRQRFDNRPKARSCS